MIALDIKDMVHAPDFDCMLGQAMNIRAGNTGRICIVWVGEMGLYGVVL